MTLLTCRETSELLRVDPGTVRAMLSRGDLEGFHRGKVTRITRESVERLFGRPLPATTPASEKTKQPA